MSRVSHDRWELHPKDPEYPPLLAASPSPPRTLYVAGDPARLAPGLGIVGARKATPYGLWAAERFATAAGERGVTVVSGAAIGCDRAAQAAALAAGGGSVAVLGCGADVDYPRSSRELLARLRLGGAVVSEMPWGSAPQRWALRERNRIIAGLSRAVLIVEAGLPSGTFSTADYALEAGREVLVVPGSIRAPECRGTNRLLRQGATPVTDVSELAFELEALGWTHELVGVGAAAPSDAARSAPPQTGDPLGRALLADPMRPDDVSWTLGMDIRDVMIAITRLEDAGVVSRYPDGRYGPPGPRTRPDR